MRNSGISIIKSVDQFEDNHFSLEKMVYSVHVGLMINIGCKLNAGKFVLLSVELSSFIFLLLYHEFSSSYDKKCPRFVDPVRGWVKIRIQRENYYHQIMRKISAFPHYQLMLMLSLSAILILYRRRCSRLGMNSIYQVFTCKLSVKRNLSLLQSDIH